MSAQRWRFGIRQGLVGVTLLLASLVPYVHAESGDEETSEVSRWALVDCIKHALENNTSIEEVKWDVALRQSEVQQAKAGYYPTAEVTTLGGVVNDAKGNVVKYHQSGIGKLSPFTRIEGQIVYPLFTWGKLSNGLKAASKGLEQEVLSVDQKKSETVREVKEYYYTLLYARQISSLLGDVREGFEKAVKTADERLQEGKITQVDVLNLKVGYAQVAKETEKLRNGVELARAALLRTMGLPHNSPIDVAETTLTPQPAQLKEFEYYVQRLFVNRPEWRKLRIGIQAKEAELQMATSDYFPTFFLAVPMRYGYAPGRSRQTNPFAYDGFNFGAAGPVVGLRWSLGFGETAAKVARSRAELMKLHSQEKTAELSFPLEVKEAYLNVTEASERMKVTADGRKAGRALITLAAANFELGLGEPQDVFLGLGNYTRAANDYYEAVKDYNIALAKLSLIVGEEVSELRY